MLVVEQVGHENMRAITKKIGKTHHANFGANRNIVPQFFGNYRHSDVTKVVEMYIINSCTTPSILALISQLFPLPAIR